MRFKNLTFALLLGAALAIGGVAWAGDEAPTSKPSVESKTKTEAKAEKPATKTPSPIHSMLKWVAGHMDGGCCPTTEAGEKAWRGWFSAGKDAPLASLRDAMVKDGWNADKTIGFFKKMAAKQKSCCGDCGSGCSDCKDCKGCDKGEKGGAADATGAADASEKGECSGCDKSKDCSGCPSKKSCGDCPSKKEAKPDPKP